MSFTTLETVNFVFVRLETSDGHVGWGEAACLGGPTWSEESAESVAARSSATSPRGSSAATRPRSRPSGSRWRRGCRAIPSRAPRWRWRSGISPGGRWASRCYRLLGGRVPGSRAAVLVARGRPTRSAEIEEAQAKVALGHRIFKIKTAAGALADDVERVRRLREALGPDDLAPGGRQSGLGPADRAPGRPGARALRPRLRRAARAALGPRGLAEIAAASRDADHGRRVLLHRTTPSRWPGSASIRILSLKLTKSAGLPAASPSPASPRRRAMGCYVGCMIETSLGTAAYLHVALAAAPVTWGCELFGPLLLAGDVMRQPVAVRRRRHPRARRSRLGRGRRRDRARRMVAPMLAAW